MEVHNPILIPKLYYVKLLRILKDRKQLENRRLSEMVIETERLLRTIRERTDEIQVIRRLLLHGAQVNAIDKYGNTCLNLGIGHGITVECVKLLLQHGANISISNRRHQTPLHTALLRKADVEVVRQLLLHGAQVNAVDKYGNTPLNLGAGHGITVECVQLLLQHGADVNISNRWKHSPLHEALSSETDVEVVRQLLLHGSKADALDANSNTPLHLGVNVQCVELLLKHGANVNATNRWNRTPLHKALFSKIDTELVEVLLHHGADVHATDCDKNTPLHFSIGYGKIVGGVQQLLEHGAGVNVTNIWKRTPLHYALYFKRDVEMVKQLLAHGARIDLPDETGITPLNAAMDHQPLAELLVKYALIHTCEGDFTNPINLNAYNHSNNYAAVASYFEKCVLELVKMKTVKVHGRFSLYAFATTKNLTTPLYSKNGSIQIVTQEENLSINYPIYSDIILARVNYALERGMLLRKLSEVSVYSRNHDGFSTNFGEKIVLNYDCLFIIAIYLLNDILCNLMLAFYNLDNSESHASDIGMEKNKSEKRFLYSPTKSCTKTARFK